MKASLLFFLLLLSACAAARRAARPVPARVDARTYYGILPCPLDCQNVRTELTLFRNNHRFVMQEDFITKTGSASEEWSRGEWGVVNPRPGFPQGVVYELTSDDFEDERYFLQVDNQTLRALDESGHEIATKSNVTLKRVKTK